MAEELVLRVYGGSVSEGMTPEPLVAIGAAPAAFRPSTPTIVDEPQAWMIAHAQDYTLYALHTLDGKTADGKDGQLQLCLFFPPQRRLGNGKSPLALLDSIRDLFAVLGMPEGHLPAQPLDNAPFRLILRNYPLEDRPVLLPVMQGSEAASYCVENSTQLDALMRHSRYDALAKVGRLELGFHCPTTVGLVLGRPGKQPDSEKIFAAEPAPDSKPESKQESQPEPKPESKPESKPEIKLDPELNLELNHEPELPPASDPTLESEPEVKPQQEPTVSFEESSDLPAGAPAAKPKKKKSLLWILAGMVVIVAIVAAVIIVGIRFFLDPYRKLTVSGEHAGVEYVDLGLSVQWARCNIGASAPIQFGETFPWGETAYKPKYTYENYKFYRIVPDSAARVTKYTIESGLMTLLPEDDIAHVRLKASWRMPTHAEYRELLENCEAMRTKIAGQTGYLFTSRINGNTLFLPMLSSEGSWEHAHYWTSSLDNSSDYSAAIIAEGSDNTLSKEIFSTRITAYMIRPVYALPRDQIGGTPLAKEADNAYDDYKKAADAVESVITNSSFTAKQILKARENLKLLKTTELSYASVDARYIESVRLQSQLDLAIQSGLDRRKKEADKITSKEKRARAYYELLQIQEDPAVKKAYNALADELQGILCADFVMLYREDGEGNYAERIDYRLVDGVMKKEDDSKITASKTDYLELYFELDTFEGLENESKYNTQTFYVKYFTPEGERMTGSASPSGYTFKWEETNVMRGKIWALGWGNSNRTAYHPGTYTVEVYTSKGRRLFRIPVDLK